MVETNTFSLKDFGLSEAKDQQKAIQILSEEFYRHSDQNKGVVTFSETLLHGKEFAILLSSGVDVCGVSTWKFYDHQQLAPQLYFQPKFEKNTLKSLRLRSFEHLVHDNDFRADYQTYAELAYSAVIEQFRGQGLGGILFTERIKKIKEQNPSAFMFDLARGDFSRLPDIKTRITDFMLQREEQQNGRFENGKIKVTGTWVPIELVNSHLSLDLSQLNENSGAQATIYQCKKNGFRFIGFSRNLSPVWCGVTD